MKQKGKEWLIRIIILMIGLTFAHLGVSLFLLSDFGTDPFNVTVQGIFRTLSELTKWTFLTHGRIHIAINLLIIIILLFIDRSYIKVGTVICMICGGPIIDFFNMILTPIFEGINTLPVRIGLLVAGCAILAYGVTIVIQSKAGTGPNDLVAVVISDKLKKKFSIIRVIVDAGFALIGYLLGGTVGVGTLICMVLVGPIAGFFLPINGRIIGSIFRRFKVDTSAKSH